MGILQQDICDCNQNLQDYILEILADFLFVKKMLTYLAEEAEHCVEMTFSINVNC